MTQRYGLMFNQRFLSMTKEITTSGFVSEGAFCVGRLKKRVFVRPTARLSARPSRQDPCALATNQQILGKNLEIRGFSVNFDMNHEKLKTCVLGSLIRIEE